MSKNIGLRILAAVVLLAAIAGIAAFAFNAGMARGTTLNIQAPAAGGQPVPYYGYGMPYPHPFPFFGFGCFGLLLPLFLLFLAFGAFRHLLWGPRMGWHHMHHFRNGAWGEKAEDSDFVPPMFAEMHRRAHAGMEKPDDSATQK
ncbi:MAG TPA: hypothetical protein VGK00_12130 [Anaerolineales bacterium]